MLQCVWLVSDVGNSVMLSLSSHLHESYNSCRDISATHICCLLVQVLSCFGSGEERKCCIWQIISLFLACWFGMRWTFCDLFIGFLNFEYFGIHTGNTRLWGWRHQPEARSRHISVYVPGHSEHQDHASEAEESLTGGMSVLARSTVQVWMDRCLHEYKQIEWNKLIMKGGCTRFCRCDSKVPSCHLNGCGVRLIR